MEPGMAQTGKTVTALAAMAVALGATAWHQFDLSSMVEPAGASTPAAEGAAGSDHGAADVVTGPAAEALGGLEVKGRAPMTEYDRDRFGQAWSDAARVDGSRNGCDTRNDVLRRDLTKVTIKPGTNGCVVQAGTLRSPYTGKTVPFERGEDSGEVQIDHVVPLADVWVKGGQQLSDEERLDVANDPLNLVAVEGSVNASKGAGDAATWRPPARGAWCANAARQIAVKAKYDLWVTSAEKRALGEMLKGCSGQQLPAADDVKVPQLATR